MNPETLIETYTQIGAAGFCIIFLGFMLTNVIKSLRHQDTELENIRENMSKMGEVISNSQSIILKLVDRTQRESEQQSDERNRRHEQLTENLGEVQKDLAKLDGVISRLNGKN